MGSRDLFQVYKAVFDSRTLRILFDLSCQGYFDRLETPLSIGKEAQVFRAVKKDGSFVCVKIYRTKGSDFKKLYMYIAQDVRFVGLQQKRLTVIRAWAQREYRNLLLAYQAGIAVPMPYVAHENVLVMEYIGDSDAAPRLHDCVPASLENFYVFVTKELKKLYSLGLAHGDLSPFNILVYRDMPVFIDFSHGVKVGSVSYRGLFLRDITVLTTFFSHYLDISDLYQEVTHV